MQATLMADGGSAAYPEILDLNPELGPALRLNNTSAVPVNGRTTVEVVGLVDRDKDIGAESPFLRPSCAGQLSGLVNPIRFCFSRDLV